MTDIVTRLRDWRNVHLARLHLLMEEAADQIAILESKLSLRENLEQGLMDGVARLQAEVERLRNGALEASETVSQNGDCPGRDNAANEDNLLAEVRRLRAAISALADQDATLSVCEGAVTVTMDATLTDEERAAVHWFAHYGLPEHHAATLRGLLERLSSVAPDMLELDEGYAR